MKRTAFHSLHREYGAKIVPFAGFEMPVQYAGIIEEHVTVRNGVGVFDVSHMGEFVVTGPNAAAFLQKITVNDVTKLSPGRVQYSAMCYEHGGIVDDLLVYELAPERYMTVVNAANLDKDLAWMRSHLIPGVSLRDDSDATSLLAVQGPKSLATLQKISSIDLSKIGYYHCTSGAVAGVEMIISRTGYTGELGFELYHAPQASEAVWNAVFAAGREFGIAPIGLGARDTLRLEMGFCLYGNDIDQTTNPLEAGLGWITKLGKGEFIGRAAIERARAEGLKRHLVGFVLTEKAVARHGYPIRSGGEEIGAVTSGTFSPTLGKAIGMGYVTAAHAAVGGTIGIDVRGQLKEAIVVSLPFLTKS